MHSWTSPITDSYYAGSDIVALGVQCFTPT
jgi:hypothetical protein